MRAKAISRRPACSRVGPATPRAGRCRRDPCLQIQKRATLVGEVTGGGAHFGNDVLLPEGIIAFNPTGRAINPATKANWERVGVHPDLVTSASDAMKIAYAASLKDIIATADDPEQREGLSGLLVRVEEGEVSLPGYTPSSR